MENVRDILIQFAKHLNDSRQLKKGTVISDEVKYFLERKLVSSSNDTHVTDRLNWMVEEMDKAKPFSQSYNNLNERYSRLLEAKNILDKEGIWL